MNWLLLLTFISLSTAMISSPYASVYSSSLTGPANVSQTPGNSFIEQNSLNPQIVTAGKNEYVVWEEGEGDIYFRKSVDGGSTFNKTINLTNITGTARNPHMATSGNNVYVTWLHNTESIYSIFFKKSTDGGVTFDKTINLSNITASPEVDLDSLDDIIKDTRYPSVVASGNNVYVIWLDNVTRTLIQPIQIIQDNLTDFAITNPTPEYEDEDYFDIPIPEYEDYFDIFFKRSTDAGASFGNTLNLSNSTSNTQNPHLAIAGDIVYLVWNGGVGGIYFRRSTDGGTNFEPTVNLAQRENSTSWLDTPQISASNSNVYLVYQQSYDYSSSSSEEKRKPQLFFISSNNSGATFSKPIILSNDNGVYDGSEDNALVYSFGDNVYVVWPTDIIDSSQEYSDFQSEVYLRRSTNGGASFEPIVNLSDNTIKGTSETPRLVANRSNLYIAWDISTSKGVPHFGGAMLMVPLYFPVLTRSTDGGVSFDTAINVTGSGAKLSVSENDASSVWSQNGEIFFRKVGSAPLSPFKLADSQTLDIRNVSESVLVDGKIGKGEWENIPSSSLEELVSTGGIDDAVWERIPSTVHQSDNKLYHIKLASTYDNDSSYFVFGVQSPDFMGGSNLTLMFDNGHDGKLNNGDDILKILGRSASIEGSEANFEDSFWSSDTTPQVQRDEDYGGTQDGYAASSFYNGTEVFEVIHPLCSGDSNHDFCITDPNQILGFSLKFEVNDSSSLLFFNDLNFDEEEDMYPFSLSKGGVYDACPGCVGAPAPTLIPPAAYILEPFQRLSSGERAVFLGNLTSEEQTELLTGPTEEGVKDFLMSKLTPEQLGDFLMNELTPDETNKLFKSISEDDIMHRLEAEDRKALSDKLSSYQLAK